MVYLAEVCADFNLSTSHCRLVTGSSVFVCVHFTNPPLTTTTTKVKCRFRFSKGFDKNSVLSRVADIYGARGGFNRCITEVFSHQPSGIY